MARSTAVACARKFATASLPSKGRAGDEQPMTGISRMGNKDRINLLLRRTPSSAAAARCNGAM
jgi:hypothetical protein